MQLEGMADAYMEWYAALGQEGIGKGNPVEFEGEINAQTIIVVDIFRKWSCLTFKFLLIGYRLLLLFNPIF